MLRHAQPSDSAKGSAQQLAYEYIKERILSGQFEGGRKITADGIAQDIGLSRMPVRMALRQLDVEGLVTILPNRGARVTILSSNEVLELFEMRAVLEAQAIRCAYELLTDDQIADLELLESRMERARNNSTLWLERHAEFHDYLCSLSKRPQLTATIQRLRATLHPYILMYQANLPAQEMLGYAHTDLLRLLRRKQAGEMIEKAARDHVLRAGRSLVSFLKKLEADNDNSKKRRPASPPRSK
jgi:DNA-binding GntR family transcriptional regulator